MSNIFHIIHNLPTKGTTTARFSAESLEKSIEKFRRAYPTLQIKYNHEFGENKKYLCSYRFNMSEDEYNEEVKKLEKKYNNVLFKDAVEQKTLNNQDKKLDIDVLGSIIGIAVIIGIIFIVILLNKDSDPTLTQQDCLEIGMFEYKQECRPWSSIPSIDQEEVMTEIAGEIAESRGITEDEALIEILQIIKSHAGQ